MASVVFHLMLTKGSKKKTTSMSGLHYGANFVTLNCLTDLGAQLESGSQILPLPLLFLILVLEHFVKWCLSWSTNIQSRLMQDASEMVDGTPGAL